MTGADIRSLPLSPLEGFVLSRIDGSATVGDIADLTSLDTGLVLATVEKLISLEAVEWADGATSLPKPSVRPPPSVASKVFGAPASRVPPGPELGVPVDSVPPAPRVPVVASPLPDEMPLPDMPGAFDDDEEPTDVRSHSTAPSAKGAGMHVYSVPIVETVERPPQRPPSSPRLPSTHPSGRPPSSQQVPSVRPPSSQQVPSVRPPPAHAPPTHPSPAGASRPSAPLTRPQAAPSVSPRSPTGPTPSRPAPGPSAPPVSAPPQPGAPKGSAAPPIASKPPSTEEAPAEIDMPEEKRRKIDELYVIVDLLDHYQVLGIERSADRAKVKSSYFELSKQFHPDTAFRKNVGPYRQKMEVIFKRLTEAYDVLSKKKAREEYDTYLERSEQSAAMEQTLSGESNLGQMLAALEAEEARRGAGSTAKAASPAVSPAVPSPVPPASPARPSPAPPPSPTAQAPRPTATSPLPAAPASGQGASSPGVSSPGVPPPPPRESRPLPTDEAKRRAQELFTRRLDASRAQGAAERPTTGPLPAPGSPTGSLPPRTSAPAPAPGAPASTKEDVLRGLASSLKGAAQLTGGLDPASRHVADARRTLAEGDLAGAVRKLRLAMALAPDNAEIKAEHDHLARKLAASLADNYAEQATYEERHHKWAAAAISWSKVVDGRPDDPGPHWRAARALLESSGDVKQAVRFAQRAVELAREDPHAVRTLGRAFMQAGMSLNARRELERAIELDPKDEHSKQLLKELKQA